jgi:hypothetical protein
VGRFSFKPLARKYEVSADYLKFLIECLQPTYGWRDSVLA